MEPEVDFEEWFSVSKEMINDLDQFSHFLPGFQRLFESLNCGDFFDLSICIDPSSFSQKLMNGHIKPLLYKEKLTASGVRVSIDFLKICLLFSLYGVNSNQVFFVLFANEIICKKDYPLYISTSRKKLHLTLVEYYLELGASKTIMDAIEYNVQSFSLLCPLVSIISSLVDPLNPIESYFNSTISCIHRILSLNCFLSEVSSLFSTLETLAQFVMKSKMDTVNIVDSLMKIYYLFLRSELFEFRRLSYKSLKTLIGISPINNSICIYISKNIEIVTKFEFHSEYSQYLGEILLNLVEKESINPHDILTIWSMKDSLHETDQKSFFTMFIKSAEKARGELLSTIVDCFLNKSVCDNIWINNILTLINVFQKKARASKEIDYLKGTLENLAFSPENPLKEQSREALIQLVGYNADLSGYHSTLLMLSKIDNIDSMSFCFSLLKRIVLSGVKLDTYTYQDTINRCFELFSSLESITFEIIDFFEALLEIHRQVFTSEHVVLLIQNRKRFPNFFSLMNTLCSYSVILPSFIELFYNEVPSDELDMDFFCFLKTMIKLYNKVSDGISSLPLQAEDILFKLSLNDSKIRIHCSELMCKIFASNDGIALTDESMISYFLNKWYGFDRENDMVISLLGTFVDTLESLSICHIQRHKPEKERIKTVITCSSPEFSTSFDLTPSTTISIICELIAKQRSIKVSTVAIFKNQAKLRKKQRLYSLVDDNTKTLFFECKYIRSKSSYFIHDKKVFPSTIILQQSWFNDFSWYLEKSNEFVYRLLCRLPTIPSYEEKVRRIVNEHNSVDIKNILPMEYPYVFSYNLTTISNILSPIKEYSSKINEILKSNGIEEYLLQSLELFIQKETHSSIEIEILNHIFDIINDYVVLSERSRLVLFNSAINLLKRDYNIYFVQLVSTLNSYFAGRLKRTIPYDSEFDTDLSKLLMDNNQALRELSLSVFEALIIPLEIFNRIFDLFLDNITIEFMNCLTSHFIDDFSNIQIIKCSHLMVSLLGNVKHTNQCLKIINIIIQLNLFPSELKSEVVTFLIKQYLDYDITSESKSSYHEASLCIFSLLDCLENGEFVFFLHFLGLLSSTTGFTRYNLNGDNILRKSSYPSGLKNLGATCYINATIQQLYSIKPIRDLLIKYKGNDKLIRELSILFTRMSYSNNKFFDLHTLISNVSWWDGLPISKSQQQDAVEFFQIICEKIIQDEEIGGQFAALIRGSILHRIEGIEVQYESQNLESFTNIDVETRSCQSLEDSINIFSKPDYLTKNSTQYYADQLGMKIDAKRMSMISEAPPVLVIHLKRFNYDFSSGERTKVCSPLHIPLSISIDSCSTMNHPIYSLNGVIIHKGNTALSGHYISLAKHEQWYSFDDEDVSRVTEDYVVQLSKGGADINSIGYIAFYSSISSTEDYDICLDPDIRQIIDRENHENRLINLLCSKGFHDLIYLISTSTIHKYHQIALMYLIRVLPYTFFCHDSTHFFNNILGYCSKDLLDFVSDSEFGNCILLCPSCVYRTNFVNICKSIVNKTNACEFYNKSYSLMPLFKDNYRQGDQLFEFLYFLSQFEEIYPYHHQLLDRIIYWYNVEIDIFLLENPGIKRSYLISGLDLTHILLILVDMPQIPQSLFSEKLFVDIIFSKSSAESISRFINRFFPLSDFVNFMKNQYKEIPIDRLYVLLCNIIPDHAFEVFISLQTSKSLKPNDETSIVSTVAYVVSINENAAKVTMQHHFLWLSRYILSDKESIRSNCSSIVARLIGHEMFIQNSRISIPDEMFLDEPPFKLNSDFEMMKIRASVIINDLLKLIPQLNKVLISDIKAEKGIGRADVFFSLIEKLVSLSSFEIDLSPICLSIDVLTKASPYSSTLTLCLSIISNYNIPIPEQTIISCIPKQKKVKKSQIPLFNNFLEPFILILRRFSCVSDVLFTFLVTNCVFIEHSVVSKSSRVINILINHMAVSSKEQFSNYIEINWEKCAAKNYQNLVTSLEVLGIHKDIWQFLPQSIKDISNIGGIIKQTLLVTSMKTIPTKILDMILNDTTIPSSTKETLVLLGSENVNVE